MSDAAPSHAGLFAEGCLAQRPFIDGSKLREFAEHRGLQLPLFPQREVLQPMDLAGAFSPIGFRMSTYTGETNWLFPDSSNFHWREETQPRDWRAHAWRGWPDDPPAVSECYSPWQLLYLPDALSAVSITFDARAITADEPAPFDNVAARVAGHLDRWTRLDEQWRPFIKLLIALQPRFWPYRSQRTTLLHEVVDGRPERVDPLRRAHEIFDPARLLERFALSLNDVAWLHYALAENARRLDPMPHLYRLLDRAPRHRTDLLRGEALRARDLYDAAFMLRSLYLVATKKHLPEADVIDQTDDWERRHLPRPQQPEPRSRLQLKPLLIREGLYPHLIHFFVEGVTEDIVLECLLDFFELDADEGMTITNIGGIDKAERYGVLFSAATQYATRTVFVGDREGEIDRTIRQLRQAGVFTLKSDVLLWEVNGRPSNFEEANFSYAELVKAMTTATQALHPSAELQMTPDDLRSEFERELANADASKLARPALGDSALKLARNPKHGTIRLSKRELAPYLGDILIDAIKSSGRLDAVGEQYPLLQRLAQWLATTR